MPTFHPAAVLRGGGEPMAQMRADFVRAKRELLARASHGPRGRHERDEPDERVREPVVVRTTSVDETRKLGAALAELCPAG